MIPSIALALLWLAAPSYAQTTPAGPLGYVVRVDSGSVYLDFSEKTGASVGRPFHIYTEGTEVKHPVTGQSLGRAETTVARGTLKEVLPMMSIGAVSSSTGEIKQGMRARLGEKPAPPAPPVQTVSSKPGDVPLRAPHWKSPVFDFQATGMTVADFKGDGTLQVALADTKKVRLYPYPPADDKPLAEFAHPGIAPRIVSLESADLNGNGKAELFVSLYNETFTRFETLVLELDGGRWKQLADLPWLVRAHQDGSGRRTLACQQLVEDATFPFSGIYPVVFKDGKYSQGKDPIKHKRVDWIYGFTKADLDGHAPALLYLTTTDKLRVQFEKNYWKTTDSFGQTPTRVRWQGKLLEFHPPMPVGYDDQKRAAVYLAKNISMLGSLSEPFGLFNSAEIHRKSWNGVSLVSDWKSELGGYSTALALATPPGKAEELAVVVVGTSGKSMIWTYEP